MTCAPELRARIREQISKLSPRQKEIVELVACNFLDKEIADALGIAFKTVRGHLDIVREKIGWGRWEIVAYHPVKSARMEQLKKKHKLAA